MSFYAEQILPRLLILACGVRPVTKQREKIVPRCAMSGDSSRPRACGGWRKGQLVSLIWTLNSSTCRARKFLWTTTVSTQYWLLIRYAPLRILQQLLPECGGCSMKKDILKILAAAGFRVEDDNRMYIPGIKALSYNYWGAATIR